ncbi:MAG: glycogen/starch synthase [Bacteroidota bacterium]
MKILHVSAECYPVAKVGGLADVVGALPKYQNNLGVESSVVMPFYNNAFTQNHTFETVWSASVKLDVYHNFRILKLEKSELGFDLFLVDLPNLLHTQYVYSHDDTERFIGFQIAVLQWITEKFGVPDIIHCHDHHTGLIPFMMSHSESFSAMKETPSVFTIHNAQYQGWFSHDKLYLLPEFNFDVVGLLDWDGSVNPLAAAIKCAWKVTTVSPNYMEELKKEANGLQSLLSHEQNKCSGVLNGIDTYVWNPETDPFIVKNYGVSNRSSGKKANKKWLCETYGFDRNAPLFVFIGRLVGEKGADLFPDIFRQALESAKISILLLGSGNEVIESNLKPLTNDFEGSYNQMIGYNEELSHRMYAGADFLLMPSRVEPCGLNQLYALRYGTIPIVSSVGGLKDTVVDIDDGGFGIRHENATVEAVCEAIGRATLFYRDEENFQRIGKSIMKIDHSWTVSAQTYINLYESIK